MAAATLSESMPRGHRDDRAAVGRLLPARREPVPLRAQHQRQPVDPGHGLLDRDGVVGQGQRHRGEAAAAQRRERVVPVRQPGPRQREHRAHRDLDRPAVERVGAARRQQHGVEAERGAASGRSRRRWCGRRSPPAPGPTARPRARRPRVGQRPAFQRGQRAAVHVEAGDLLGQRLGHHVAGRVASSPARRPARRASAAPSGTSAARWPASTARRTTFSPSARNSPCSASRCLRSSTSRRSR